MSVESTIKGTYCMWQSCVRKPKLLFKTVFFGACLSAASVQAQVGALLWEDNFTRLNTDHWSVDVGDGCDIGLCGWGNQELQWYARDNAYIAPVPGEAGNSALVLEARRESANGRGFTSGKVQSQNKVAVQYGMIETRIRVPNLGTGLWPAAWMLGTSTEPWPRKGEIDMMEMGHRAEEKARQGHPGADNNSYVGSNIIFYADAACVPGNPTCAASTAYDVGQNKPYVASSAMNDRFVVYRTYWTATQIRFTIVDQGTEYDLYESAFNITPESSAMQAPFYLLLNLAVGGNFTDAANPGQVTAPMAAPMYIDYVRVYEYNGQGEVFVGNVTAPESGAFGVFTDNTPTTNKLEIGVDADVYLWDPNSQEGSEAPYEGANVMAWRYTNPGTWFGAGVQARQARDMGNFVDGELSFSIKIPADIDFRIGVTDTYTNENWISFPANQHRYGLVRNGQWGRVTIPVAALRGELIALQSMHYLFAISSNPDNFPGRSFDYAIDDIVWHSGVEDSDGDGVADGEDQCPNSPAGAPVDARGCPLTSPPQDSDNDGVADADDACPGTPPGRAVDAQGCTLSSALSGALASGADQVEFFVNTRAWADLHYRVNNGAQQNVRMTQTGASNRYTVSGLSSGDALRYFFTYWDEDGGFAVDTGTATYTHRGDGTPPEPTLPPEPTVPPAPADSDSDGVPDVSDACPATPAGSQVDSRGCSLSPLRLSASARASSELGAAAFAVDGNMSTRWESNHGADPSSITFDLGARQQLSSITIHWEAANAASYVVEGSTDGLSWSRINSFSGGVFGNRTDTLDLSGDFRYLRIYGTARPAGNDWGYSIWEVEIYGYAADGSDGDGDGDSDADGVPNGRDSCPGTPANTQVDANGCPVDINPGDDSDGDMVSDGRDDCPNTPFGAPITANGCPIYIEGAITPLFNAATVREPNIVENTPSALITRIADRARDRHAREDQFQLYDHYLTFYWEHRTAAIEIVDTVGKGGNSITFNVKTQWKLSPNEAELRFFYRGVNTVAEYFNNGVMRPLDEHNYTRSVNYNQKEGRELRVGDRMEFELSQFLDTSVPNGRANYYGTTYLYIVGQGIVPWEARGNLEDSYPIPRSAKLGGDTTLGPQYSNEPNDHFMQMATNLGYGNGQAFVLGRRIHHTDFVNGVHDEPGNPGFDELSGLAGTHYISSHCTGCHGRNGRAVPAALGEPLDKWVFKIGDAFGMPEAQRGAVLQPKMTSSGAVSEGSVAIESWTQSAGLRSPNYVFSGARPTRFSARIAPQLVGLGLLEAIPEADILALEDENDRNGDGISGRAQRSVDPRTSQTRLGRFGWKAGAASLEHQIAKALNTDIGVMSTLLPNPDCGSAQSDCGTAGAEIADEHFDHLVKYVALLGVRAQRDSEAPEVLAGKRIFSDIGCASCHRPEHKTGEFHPLGELRNQTIYPYTDLLLHDMGPGLADNLGEANASGAEWRTTPLWGLGLSACVTGGVENPSGNQGAEVCRPAHGYLHDGRARSIEEAILWHGGEGQGSNDRYQGLSAGDKARVLRFLRSL